MHITIDQAIKLLLQEEVVALPTETVYGLGAIARSSNAVSKIYALKSRPKINPLIVHVTDINQAESLVEINDNAKKLFADLAPGPITIVLPLKPNANVSEIVTAGLNTLAVRIPEHKIMKEVIKGAGPIAAPSANISGMLSSVTSSQVEQNFGKNLPVIDGGRCRSGLESTIVDCSSDVPMVLRLGAIPYEFIADILPNVVMSSSLEKIKAPGMLKKHYSTKTKLKLNQKAALENELALNFGNSNIEASYSLNLSQSGDLFEAAGNLYFMLNELDNYAIKHNLAAINIAPIPEISLGRAINDRLRRAIE